MTDAHSHPMAALMSCSDAHSLLWEFLDGELDAERAAGVRLHAAACPACVRRLEGARTFRRAVQRGGRADVAPPTLRPRVLARLRAHGLLA